MHKIVRKLLLGLLIWAVPFVVSIFVWDPEAGGPAIPLAWFNALMAFTWTIGFSIAAYLWFKDIKKKSVEAGWCAGITWYIELVVLDLIVLVGLFGMSLAEFYPLAFTYLNTVLLCAGIGYIIGKK